MQTNVDESKLNMLSKLVESFSGIRIPTNKPLIGEFVFTQCSGVHADGDSKSNLYFNDLLPERFGRERKYALGKTSGKANIKKNLEEIGINHLCQLLKHPIALEVEIPEEEMAKRRINFYQRQGFSLWEKPYQQPPYKTGDNYLPMLIMAYGDIECGKDFDSPKQPIRFPS